MPNDREIAYPCTRRRRGGDPGAAAHGMSWSASLEPLLPPALLETCSWTSPAAGGCGALRLAMDLGDHDACPQVPSPLRRHVRPLLRHPHRFPLASDRGSDTTHPHRAEPACSGRVRFQLPRVEIHKMVRAVQSLPFHADTQRLIFEENASICWRGSHEGVHRET